jgi:hypothetical protein
MMSNLSSEFTISFLPTQNVHLGRKCFPNAVTFHTADDLGLKVIAASCQLVELIHAAKARLPSTSEPHLPIALKSGVPTISIARPLKPIADQLSELLSERIPSAIARFMITVRIEETEDWRRGFLLNNQRKIRQKGQSGNSLNSTDRCVEH